MAQLSRFACKYFWKNCPIVTNCWADRHVGTFTLCFGTYFHFLLWNFHFLLISLLSNSVIRPSFMFFFTFCFETYFHFLLFSLSVMFSFETYFHFFSFQFLFGNLFHFLLFSHSNLKLIFVLKLIFTFCFETYFHFLF